MILANIADFIGVNVVPCLSFSINMFRSHQ